jgi:hypothetical protein
MDKLLEQLKRHFSEQRLMPYEKLAKIKNADAVSLYKLNILLCEELYAFISCIEVCLRNNIHKKMTEVFGKESWYIDVCWGEKHKDQLNSALEKLQKTKVQKYKFTSDDVICSVSFGFWCHMFDNFYEPILWVKGLNKIFSYYPESPNRKYISTALNALLQVRNKIAHFESIIKDEQQLLKTYNLMTEVINWMTPEIYLWFKNFNDFTDLYKQLTGLKI